MKELPVVVLKGYSYVGASLYKLHVPNAFGRRVGFDLVASHIFPQGVLAAITLVVGGAGDGVESEPNVSWNFLSSLWP